MTLNEFQALSRRTFKGKGANISNAALGIAGEAGEIADYVKKCLYQGHQYDVAVMVEELGDLLFYIANMASLCGVALEDVAKFNYEKLLDRYPDGFEVERSVNR